MIARGLGEIASCVFETGEIHIEFVRGRFRVTGTDRELEPGVRQIEMPASQVWVWRAIQSTRASV
jgi:hypothetical protein